MVSKANGGKEEDNDFSNSILSTLNGSTAADAMKVKALRKLVFMSLQCDEDDKHTKKKFKKAVQALESSGKISLDEDGTVTLLEKVKKDKKKKKKKKKDKKKEESFDEDAGNDKDDSKDDVDKTEKKKTKKKKREEEDGDNIGSKESKKRKMDSEADDDDTEQTDEQNKTNAPEKTDPNKNKKCKGNPSGITRLFVGNLPFSVDEDSLESFLQPAVLTHIKWITDQETGKFYGSAFVEMRNSRDAALALSDKNGQPLMNRQIKINYAPARPGDVWPPKTKVWTGGKQRSAGGSGVKAMSPKPDGCTKLFIGNLSYDIDDEGISKFFRNVDAEIKTVRWLSHKDTGDFKGVGFVEFWNTEACEKAATLNGKNLLGRPIRIDWDAS